MPEIGATLRETRMRAGLDISDIEASTKIRAKYLRAIENEEWNLLPGPTFAKTFLRTYAETLGLDSRLLLEEYKARYERYDEHELRPVPLTAPSTGRGLTSSSRGGGGRGGGRRGLRPWMVLVLLAAIVAVVLFVLGTGDDDKPAGSTTTVPTASETTAETTARTTRTTRTTERERQPAAEVVRLQIVPTGSVYVCLTGGGRTLIDGQVLEPDSPPGTFRSRRFLVALGNGNATLKIDGETTKVANTGKPVGYEITSEGRTRLRPSQLPTCG